MKFVRPTKKDFLIVFLSLLLIVIGVYLTPMGKEPCSCSTLCNKNFKCGIQECPAGRK